MLDIFFGICTTPHHQISNGQPLNTNFRQNPFTIQNSKIPIKNLIDVHDRKLFTIVNNLRVGKGKSSITKKKNYQKSRPKIMSADVEQLQRN